MLGGSEGESTYDLFTCIDRKWVGRVSMRGEETVIAFDEEARELLRTDFGQNRGSVRGTVFVVVQRRPLAHPGIGFYGHG